MRRDAPAKRLIVHGEGPTATAALQALLGRFPATAAGAGDHTAIFRASASTLELLVPALIGALQVTQDDLGLEMTAATVDGLIATDEGWRAWGTVSGQLTDGARPVRHWAPGAATVEQANGAVSVRVTLTEEQGDA